MTNEELIISQAKRIATLESVTEYQNGRITELESQLRVRDNITESGDPLPLDALGIANKVRMNSNA